MMRGIWSAFLIVVALLGLQSRTAGAAPFDITTPDSSGSSGDFLGDAAFNGRGVVVAWVHAIPSESNSIRVRQLSVSGVPIGPAIEVARNGAVTNITPITPDEVYVFWTGVGGTFARRVNLATGNRAPIKTLFSEQQGEDFAIARLSNGNMVIVADEDGHSVCVSVRSITFRLISGPTCIPGDASGARGAPGRHVDVVGLRNGGAVVFYATGHSQSQFFIRAALVDDKGVLKGPLRVVNTTPIDLYEDTRLGLEATQLSGGRIAVAWSSTDYLETTAAVRHRILSEFGIPMYWERRSFSQLGYIYYNIHMAPTSDDHFLIESTMELQEPVPDEDFLARGFDYGKFNKEGALSKHILPKDNYFAYRKFNRDGAPSGPLLPIQANTLQDRTSDAVLVRAGSRSMHIRQGRSAPSPAPYQLQGSIIRP